MSSDSNNTPHRRGKLLRNAGATFLAMNLVGGCGGDITPESPQAPNGQPTQPATPQAPKAANQLLGLLEQYAFTDNQGNDVNTAALGTALNNNNVAVSFGFRRCRGICPYVNDSLAALGERLPGLKYLVVSSDRRDNENQTERNAFLQELVDRGMDRRDIIILYPKDRSKQDDLQVAMGAPTAVPEGGPAHTSYIFLYNGEGRQVAKATGKNDDPSIAANALLEQARNSISASRSASR